MVHLSPGGLPTRVLSKSKAPGVDSPKPQQMSRKCFEHDRSQFGPTLFTFIVGQNQRVRFLHTLISARNNPRDGTHCPRRAFTSIRRTRAHPSDASCGIWMGRSLSCHPRNARPEYPLPNYAGIASGFSAASTDKRLLASQGGAY
jgi:hypothetical protein